MSQNTTISVGEYKQTKAKHIIEDAISQLVALGMDVDGAASLLVIQGMIRIESSQKRNSMIDFANSCSISDE